MPPRCLRFNITLLLLALMVSCLVAGEAKAASTSVPVPAVSGAQPLKAEVPQKTAPAVASSSKGSTLQVKASTLQTKASTPKQAPLVKEVAKAGEAESHWLESNMGLRQAAKLGVAVSGAQPLASPTVGAPAKASLQPVSTAIIRSVPLVPGANIASKLAVPLPKELSATVSPIAKTTAELSNTLPAKPKLAPLSAKNWPAKSLLSSTLPSSTLPVVSVPQQKITPAALPKAALNNQNPAPTFSSAPVGFVETAQSPLPVPKQLASFQQQQPPQKQQSVEPLLPVLPVKQALPVVVPVALSQPNSSLNEAAALPKQLGFWERFTARFRRHEKRTTTANAPKTVEKMATALMVQPLSPVPVGVPAEQPLQQRLSGLAIAFGAAPVLPYMAAPSYTPTLVYGAMKQPVITEASKAELVRFIAKSNRNLLPYQQEGIANGILEMSGQQGVDYRLVASLLAVESSFRTDAISSTGAIGLGQLKSFTAKWLQVSDPFDPVDNLTGVSKYLRYLVGLFPGQVEKAVASYYMGQGNVQRQGLNESGWGYVRKVDLAYQNLLHS